MNKKSFTIGTLLFLLASAGIITWDKFFSYCAKNPNDPTCQEQLPSPPATPTPSPTAVPTSTPTTPPTATPTPIPGPTSSPTTPPTTPPSVPPSEVCLAGTCPNIYIHAKIQGANFLDSTMRCRNKAYCEKATGVPGTVDCALGNEGTDQRRICELQHAPGCHRWYFKTTSGSWERCMPGEHPWASCDHYDRWQEWRYSQPGCNHKGCPQEYNPYTGYCTTNAKDEPVAGYQMIPHGKTQFMACGSGATEKVCSNPLTVDQ